MSAPTYIVDKPLPLSEDFKSLRKEAMAYIQEYTGDEWTNLNASDPGVTILDQVCFALTELGYCNSFPVEDILTLPNGELRLKDQFYLPEDILTTSPVTAQDYIKYLVDGVAGVKNAIITVVPGGFLKSSYRYQVYLLTDPSITEKADIGVICKAAFFYLNAARNLGELFLPPLPLIAAPHFITGNIEIENQTVLDAVMTGINDNIRGYIFPAAVQSGYDQLVQNGFDVDEVFNGPLLQHGWIATAHLGEKQDKLTTLELTTLISNVPGVKSVSNLNFDGTVLPCKQITSGGNEILVIDLAKSRLNGLNITWPGKSELKPLTRSDQPPASGNAIAGAAPAKTRLVSSNIQLGAAIKVQTEVPLGKYRDINTYYSIQNTFPEVFAVGPDATISNASDFQIAQSRQLKGYLTLFDQVLANQFSQLANIGQLFSFKNAMTGTPSDKRRFYDSKDNFEQEHPEYPVPYLTFSPTYFYQSLYDIPHIRPLLKDNDIYKFSNELESDKELKTKSWAAYKLDPYNSYIRGLMTFVEEGNDSLIRRNNILDHLLARHGESPLLMELIIEDSIYTADRIKDQVIFKSLYLQNLGLLSYFRQKAYNYLAAGKVPNEIGSVPAKNEWPDFGDDDEDFIFDSARVDRIEKLKEQDFVNYSAVELKLCMLLGLRTQYKAVIVGDTEDQNIEQAYMPYDIGKKEIALWMMTKRRGTIFIEMDLLFQSADFEIIFKVPGETVVQYQGITNKLNYAQAISIARALLDNTDTGLAAQLGSSALNICGSSFSLNGVNLSPGDDNFSNSISDTDCYFMVRINFDIAFGQQLSFINNAIFFNRAVFLFPDFVPQFISPAFQGRLNLLLQETLPVQMPFDALFISADLLKAAIPLFAAWHNALIYDGNKELAQGELNHCAGALAKQLDHIYSSKK